MIKSKAAMLGLGLLSFAQFGPASAQQDQAFRNCSNAENSLPRADVLAGCSVLVTRGWRNAPGGKRKDKEGVLRCCNANKSEPLDARVQVPRGG